MNPRKEARTTKSVDRMRALIVLADPKVNAALLDNPRLPKKLGKRIDEQRKQVAKAESRKADKASAKKSPKPEDKKTAKKSKSKQDKQATAKASKPSKKSQGKDSAKPIKQSAAPLAAELPDIVAPEVAPKVELPAEEAANIEPATDTSPTTRLYSFQPVAPVVNGSQGKAEAIEAVDVVADEPPAPAPVIVEKRNYQPNEKSKKDVGSLGLATVTSIAAMPIATEPTLQDSLNRVLVAFKKEAAAAGKSMGPGTPGEIVNAFLWVSRETSTSGGDKAQYTSDWIIFTAYRCCFGRKTGFFRKGEYRVLSKTQVTTVDVEVASFADTKDPSQKPYTFVSLKFNLLDGTSLVRQIFVDRTDLKNSPGLDRVRQRLARIAALGWPLVEGASWLAVPAPEPIQDSPSADMAIEAH